MRKNQDRDITVIFEKIGQERAVLEIMSKIPENSQKIMKNRKEGTE